MFINIKFLKMIVSYKRFIKNLFCTFVVLNIFSFPFNEGVFINIINREQPTTINNISTSQNSEEFRGVWLNSYAFDNPNVRAENFKKITDANLNNVFLITPPIKNNNGWCEYDDFIQMFTILKNEGLKVYAWVACLYRTEGIEANFSDPSEQIAQKEWAIEILLNFSNLDGIHFDYIRTGSLGTVSHQSQNDIKTLLNITNQEIQKRFPGKSFSTATKPLSGALSNPGDQILQWFVNWFENPINDDINRWKTEPYNYDGIPLPFRFQQDPRTWIVESVVDFTISMEYSYSTSWWNGEVDIWNSFLGDDVSHIYMGLGYHPGVWDDEVTVTKEMVAQEIVSKIEYGRVHNIAGFCIFEFGNPEIDDYILIDALTKGTDAPFREMNQERSISFIGFFPSLSFLIIISILFFNIKNKQE